MNPKFIIKHFDDYHQIRSDSYKTIELGCFPTYSYGYCRYFGLFYKGKKPSLREVMKRIDEKVKVGDFFHYKTGENVGVSPIELREKIKQALHL